MRRTLRKTLLLVLAVVVVGAALYHIRGAIRLEGFRWRLLGESLRQANLWLLLLSIVAIYVCYALRALRWVRLSRTLGHPTFRNVYSSTLMGFAALFLLGRAGEPIRPLLIARKDHLPVSSTFGVYVIERIMDMSATAVISAMALLLFPIGDLPAGDEGITLLTAARTAGVVLLIGLIALIAFLVYFRLHGAGVLAPRLELWRAAGGWRTKLAGLLVGFSDGLQAIRTWGDLLIAAGYTAAHWLLIAFIYLWISHSFGGDLAALHFSDALLVLAFTLVGSAAQLPGVGGGAQLATFLVFTIVFGVENEPAAAAAVVLWLISFAASCLAGMPLLFREGWSVGELSRLARAEAEAEAAGRHASTTTEDGKRGERSR